MKQNSGDEDRVLQKFENGRAKIGARDVDKTVIDNPSFSVMKSQEQI